MRLSLFGMASLLIAMSTIACSYPKEKTLASSDTQDSSSTEKVAPINQEQQYAPPPFIRQGDVVDLNIEMVDGNGDPVQGALISFDLEIPRETDSHVYRASRTDRDGKIPFKFVVPRDAPVGHYKVTYQATNRNASDYSFCPEHRVHSDNIPVDSRCFVTYDFDVHPKVE